MLTMEDIERKLKLRVPPATEGDHTLNPGMPPASSLRRAAVLILLVEKEDGIHILFTERTAHLSAHAGQISFPGGGADEGDPGPVATALREAEEEIGLRPENARVLGQMQDYITRSGFHVTPIVALLERQQSWAPNDHEVARLFEVPLEYILENLTSGSLVFENHVRHFYVVEWREFRIWGATAGMLKNLANALLGDEAASDPGFDARGENGAAGKVGRV